MVTLTSRRVELLRRRLEIVEVITDVHGGVVVGTTKSHQRRSSHPCFLPTNWPPTWLPKNPEIWCSPHPEKVSCATPTSGPGTWTLQPNAPGRPI
jgi:hypothetical protein